MKEIIENSLIEVRQVISFAKQKLQSAISGSLYLKQQKGIRYYKREKGETVGQYLGKDDGKTIRELEEKLYCKELLKVSEQEEATLQKVKELIEVMPDYKSVFLKIPAEKRHLIKPYEPNTAVKMDETVRLFNKKNVPEEYKLITGNGEHVRSKSELIIADRLKAADVPYFYEDPLIMAEENKENEAMRPCLYWHPDFRVQNRRTGKQYYWEHFGMLDNPEYCKSCQEKLEIYAQYGYFAGDNLIITSESSQHGINTKYIDCLIAKYLK